MSRSKELCEIFDVLGTKYIFHCEVLIRFLLGKSDESQYVDNICELMCGPV